MSVVRLLRAKDLVETMLGRRNGRRDLEPESLQARGTDRYEQGVDRAFPSLELFDPGCDECSSGKRRKFRLARAASHAPTIVADGGAAPVDHRVSAARSRPDPFAGKGVARR